MNFMIINFYHYTQVQCQLFCTKRTFCDFIVWQYEDMHVERIYPDDVFMTECIKKAEHFFRVAILPELVGKFFSRTPHSLAHVEPGPSHEPDLSQATSSAGLDSLHNEQFCYCRGPESGRMVACDNPSCPFQWFHFKCLKMTASPKKKSWFCPDCRKTNSTRKGKKQ